MEKEKLKSKNEQEKSDEKIEDKDVQDKNLEGEILEKDNNKTQEESQTENKIKELEDKLLRLQAEFDNYHKRTDKEIEKLKKTINKDLILEILDFLDELEESIKHIKEEKQKTGLTMLYEKLLSSLKKRGLKEMGCKEFDPYKHEALMYEKGKEGEITKILKKGYLLNEEIIRHAYVCVGKEEENKEVDLNE